MSVKEAEMWLCLQLPNWNKWRYMFKKKAHFFFFFLFLQKEKVPPHRVLGHKGMNMQKHSGNTGIQHWPCASSWQSSN